MECKAVTNKRSWIKVWPIVFCCMNTSAIHIDLSTGYDTANFLLVWQRFCSLRGTPKYCYSDPGSQLVSAKKLLEGSVHTPQKQLDIDTKKVMEETARDNVTWKLAPAESQWRDGRSEQAVAAIKRTLKHLHQGKDLTFPELLTLMFRCMDIINNRPLGVRFNNGANPSYAPITPNALLKNSRTDYEELKFKDYDHINEKYVRRMKHVEKVYYDWWDLWKRDVMDSLFPFKKWKQAKQNVQVGDICFLMQDAKLGSPGYRLCRVTAVYPDAVWSGLFKWG